MTEPRRAVDLSFYNGAGLVVPYRDGVIYTNQAGGVRCEHPNALGIFIPLYRLSSEPGLEDLWIHPGTPTARCRADIDAFLLDRFPDFVYDVGTAEHIAHGEAWLPVRVQSAELFESGAYANFVGWSCILTWQNSD